MSNVVQRGLAWLFGRPTIKIVEISEPLIPVVEDEESVRALRTHPGFVMLMNKLKVQKTVLESELKRGRHETIRDVDRLQLGLFWLGYLQAEVNRSIAKQVEVKAATPTRSDEEQFHQVYAQIQGV